MELMDLGFCIVNISLPGIGMGMTPMVCYKTASVWWERTCDDRYHDVEVHMTTASPSD